MSLILFFVNAEVICDVLMCKTSSLPISAKSEY